MSVKVISSLHTAFYELAQMTDPCQISVQDLAKAANIARSSFYTHYDNIRELHSDLEYKLSDKLKKAISSFVNTSLDDTGFVGAFLSFYRENRSKIDTLDSIPGNKIWPKLEVDFRNALNSKLTYLGYNVSDTLLNFLSSGLMHAVIIYVHSGSKNDTETVNLLTKQISKAIK